MKGSTKFGITLLAGLAAGAIAGLLLAPEDGKETRKKLSKKAKKFEGLVKEKADEYGKKVSDLKEKYI